MDTKIEYPKSLMFTSNHYRNLRVWLIPSTKREIDGELVKIEGKELRFVDWKCFCDDPETIKLALTSGYYGHRNDQYISIEWEKIKEAEKNKTVEESKTDEKPIRKTKASV